MGESTTTESTTNLRDQLHRLYSLRPTLDTFSDEAIRMIVALPGIDAAAIFTYAQRKNTLNLLTADGIDNKQLDGLRGSVGRTWDIPLRSVRNKRINVVDSAHENPFVPDAIKSIGPKHLDIASIPFYHDNSAVGVALLFAKTTGAFTDETLRNVSQGLRVCGAAISGLTKAAAGNQITDPIKDQGAHPNLLRGLAALKAELLRLNTALEESERQRASEAAERVTAQSFLKAAQQRAERAERELDELSAEQARIPLLQKEAQDLDRRLKNASELAENAKNRVAELECALAKKIEENQATVDELRAMQARRTELESELKRAGELAERHQKSASELNQKVARLDAFKSEAERLSTELEEAVSARTRIEKRLSDLEKVVTAADSERTALTEELASTKNTLTSIARDKEKLESESHEKDEKLVEAERLREQLVEEHERLRASTDTTQQRIEELAKARESLENEQREHIAVVEQLNGQIAALEAQRTHLNGELERIRSESGQTLAELREQLETSDRDRTQLSQQVAASALVEEEKSRLATRLEEAENDANNVRRANEELNSTLSETQSQLATLERERSALSDKIDSLTADEQNLAREKQSILAEKDAEIDALRKKLSEIEESQKQKAHNLEVLLEAARTEATVSLDKANSDLARARDEHLVLEKELARLRQDEEAHNELLSAAATEQATLTQQLQSLTSERDQLTANLSKTQTELAGAKERATESERKISELESSLSALRDGEVCELKSLIERETNARTEAESALEAEKERHSQEIVDIQDQLSLARKERDDLLASLEEREALLASAEHGLTAIQLDDVLHGDDGFNLEIDRSGTPESDPGELPDTEIASAPGAAAAAPIEVVLLDAADTISTSIEKLTEAGHSVTSLDPEPEAASKLAETLFSCAAINLATPTAWPTLRKMRNGAGVAHTPMIAYALAQSAEKGFWLGSVDFISLPIDDVDLYRLLKKTVPDLKRIIAMSHDFDLMEQVRAKLSEKRVSTAVVLDGRQALDLVPTIKPQAAILHMSPSCTDVFRAVAGLRTQEETRNIPILFILDQEAQQREESFLTAGIRMLSGRGTLVPEELPTSIISAVDSFHTAAA